MARWEPDARGRLERAALELFDERGYDRTTVEDIAARAGLTERTFFRYFSDKREILFGGSPALIELIAGAIAAASVATAPLDAVTAGLEATAAMFQQRRGYARKRRALIAAHADLQERELIKLAALAAAIAAGLRARGVGEPVASLTAEAGVAIFKIAFERWVGDAGPEDLAHHVRAVRDQLVAVTAGARAAPAPASRRKPASPDKPVRDARERRAGRARR